jgi:hypothetical protein
MVMLTKNINSVVSIVVIAFIAAGLIVVPAIELANADSIQLLQNSTEKNSNQKDGKCPKC